MANDGASPGEGTRSPIPGLQSQLDEIVRQAEIDKNTHHPLPGARPMPLSLVRDLQFPPLGPGDFEKLPDAPGIYEVDTASGSRHIITRTRGRITWQRHPGEWSGISPFDEETMRNGRDGTSCQRLPPNSPFGDDDPMRTKGTPS